MSYDTLLFEISGQVARITLNRPDAANSLNDDMARDLMLAAIRCDEDPAIRAVLLTGAGKMFSAGGDLKTFSRFGTETGARLKEITTCFHAAISRFTRMDAPLVIAVNGMAAGAGMSLAASGDLVLAARGARFTMAYTAAGLSPDGGSTWFLPRLIGLRRTQELMLTNRMLSAGEALEWGLVNRVVDDGALMKEAESLVEYLAGGATQALGMVKKMLVESFTNPLETQMELESRAIAEMARSDDGREGIAAFVGKRKPAFTGR
ncbi:MAG: enoyl-CoA hydratase-related protein [Alphaproteobacteria bacterium]